MEQETVGTGVTERRADKPAPAVDAAGGLHKVPQNSAQADLAPGAPESAGDLAECEGDMPAIVERLALLPPGALLLDCRQAAALLHVSRAAFWKLHSQGRVPLPIRLSARIVRWRRAELESWVAEGCPPRDKWIWKRAS